MTRGFLFALAVAALSALAAADDDLGLNSEKCAQIVNAEPDVPLLEKEHCTVCDLIVENSKMWNWGQNMDSLCTGMAPHAREWCEFYACKLAECKFFQEGKCKVIRSKEMDDVVEMSPCPAKYLCSYCLQVPRTQVFGCFDNAWA